jgi:hypothetical protein
MFDIGVDERRTKSAARSRYPALGLGQMDSELNIPRGNKHCKLEGVLKDCEQPSQEDDTKRLVEQVWCIPTA